MADTQSIDTDLIICGGGPVGLYLGLVLMQRGFSVKILERKKSIDLQSKSLGIHPVSLELFDEAGIADPFLNRGIRIEKGHAFLDRKQIGTVSFAKVPPPYRFILALPQYQTEQVLEDAVIAANAGALIRGASISKIQQQDDHVNVTYTLNGTTHQVSGRFLAGCDGKNSFARRSTGIPFKGSPYPDTYIMGDFTDNTDFGPDAAVYLHRQGLIESFPLPGEMRRWVVKTEEYIEQPEAEIISDLVQKRIGHSISKTENKMVSSFGVQHQLAETFHKKRMLLVGDSAHVVSPIGGQGMNLGWLNARAAADALDEAIRNPEKTEEIFSNYTSRAKKRSAATARNAELNMWLGRARRFPLFRNLLARMIVQTPLSHVAARQFTMRGIASDLEQN